LIADTEGQRTWQRTSKENDKEMKYILAIVALLAITGCNTIQGIGQDIEALGSGLEEAAD